MSAAEWLTSRFGDYEEFCPMPGCTASREFFLDTFGPTLEAALVEGRSTYEALMATPGGTRGWELYFEDWKRRGILN